MTPTMNHNLQRKKKKKKEEIYNLPAAGGERLTASAGRCCKSGLKPVTVDQFM
jgi:hypothetical protein